jgi:hypothetical protein
VLLAAPLAQQRHPELVEQGLLGDTPSHVCAPHDPYELRRPLFDEVEVGVAELARHELLVEFAQASGRSGPVRPVAHWPPV